MFCNFFGRKFKQKKLRKLQDETKKLFCFKKTQIIIEKQENSHILEDRKEKENICGTLDLAINHHER